MKIVLVSPFNIANYGAMLQSWALRTVLERMGHEVRHLNVPWVWHGVRSWWKILKSKSLQSIIAKIKINKMLREAYMTMGNPPMTRPYASCKDLQTNPPDADCYIAGSDQIWGEDRFLLDKDINLVLLNFGSNSILRLAYAPSLAKACWTEEGKRCAREFKNLFSRFKALSSREDSGCRLVSDILDRKCVWVPDPTLLLEQKDYLKLLGLPEEVPELRPHIFTYLLGFGADHRRRMVASIIEDIETRDTMIKDVHNVQVPENLDKWLLEMVYSSYVVTNSFHGLCFSLIFHRPFIIVGFDGEEEWRNERVKSLLRRIGLIDRFVSMYDKETVDAIINARIDWSMVDSCVDEFRMNGYDFLKGNLN